jgi:hypothetical protein
LITALPGVYKNLGAAIHRPSTGFERVFNNLFLMYIIGF